MPTTSQSLDRTPPRRALLIGAVWPEPRSSAAGCYVMQLLHTLQQADWELHVASAARPGENRENLQRHGIAEHTIAINDNAFDHWINTLNPALVLFDRFMTEEQFGWRVANTCPDAMRVLVTQDLHCLREARQRWCKENPGSVCSITLAELFDRMAGEDIALRELAAIYRNDLSLLVSSTEANWLTQHFGVPANLLCHIPFLLDKPDVSQWRPFAPRNGFVCIGNFLHAPNMDAVLWLKQQLWPMIRQRLPAAELRIYGAYTPDRIRTLHKPSDGFLVHGHADDAMTVLSEARALLAPLRFGAGIKGKLSDAMLCGTPSITTGIGAESMQTACGWPGVIADEPEQFVHAAVALHEDKQAWLQAQQHCLPALVSFDSNSNGKHFLDTLSHLQQTLTQKRQSNVTGAILRHQQYRSTEYMSRWIEAKNRLLQQQERGSQQPAER